MLAKVVDVRAVKRLKNKLLVLNYRAKAVARKARSARAAYERLDREHNKLLVRALHVQHALHDAKNGESGV